MVETPHQIAATLWVDLPELVRNYPSEKRDDAREAAYSYFDRFAKVRDEESLQRLRFVLEQQEDVRAAFVRRDWE